MSIRKGHADPSRRGREEPLQPTTRADETHTVGPAPRRPQTDFDQAPYHEADTRYGGSVDEPGRERLHDQAYGQPGYGNYEREIRERYGLSQGGYPEVLARPLKAEPRWRRPDHRIYEDICDAMTEHPDLDATDVEVAVVGGEVTLKGSVPDRQSKRLADDVANSICGVLDVHNRLQVQRSC